MRALRAGMLLATCLVTRAFAQAPPSSSPPFGEQLAYLLGQARSGFRELRSDPIAAGMWHARYRIDGQLDSATAVAATSISELPRQHADGSPGVALVGVFPLTLVAPGDTTLFARYRKLIAAGLPNWQDRSPGGGDWSECADPRRGREVILSPGRTASGQTLLMLSITVHPDAGCS